MVILGLETSCDDTAAAVLAGSDLRSSVVSSQDAVHGPYGGIVPELASRHHLANLLAVLQAALDKAAVAIGDVEGIAVTYGPGLVGSLLVGLSAAKGIALTRGVPLVGVNHLEGHLLAIFLERRIEFPYVALLASGGHTSLYLVEEPGRYRRVGATRDDAAGEAFDKAAKMLGLGFPGGRVIDRLARSGDPKAIRFPRAMIRGSKYDFSFSGVKTALREFLRREHGVATSAAGSAANRGVPERLLRDIAASFQEAVVDMLVTPTLGAAEALGVPRIVVSGGVSANSRLRARMESDARRAGFTVAFPSPCFCTDNAAMIAYAGARRLERGERDDLSLNAEASLPL
jgi:N6-L-threonylcarbamoyladenine synthase